MEKEEENRLKQLKEVVGVIKEFKRKFFLLGGSALLAYRDKKLQSRHTGIGLYGYNDSDFQGIKKRLLEIGFNDDKFPAGTVIQVRKEDYYFMIFYLDKKDDFWFSYTNLGPYLYIPDVFHKFEKVKFYGLEFNVPSPIKSYLYWCYGESWWDRTQENHCHPPAGIFIPIE